MYRLLRRRGEGAGQARAIVMVPLRQDRDPLVTVDADRLTAAEAIVARAFGPAPSVSQWATPVNRTVA